MAMSSAAQTKDHRVEVTRSGGWWAITVPALDGVFSQAKRLDQVDDSAREAISLMLDIDEDDVGALDIIVTPPARAAELLRSLEVSVAAADEATRVAAATRREVAEVLRAEGLPLRDVGELIGVSHQRVSQLLAS
jgi:predicted RNase H-like HicB family nuclease